MLSDYCRVLAITAAGDVVSMLGKGKGKRGERNKDEKDKDKDKKGKGRVKAKATEYLSARLGDT